MIEVEKVNGQKIWINGDHIKFLEKTPDTVVTMTNDEKLLLRTSVEDILAKMRTK